jgi:hypothetical protein
MQRRTFLKSAGMAGSMLAVSPPGFHTDTYVNDDFPLMDLHVHLTDRFTINYVMAIAKKTGVRFGIVVNPGYGVNDDVCLERIIKS